MNSKNNSRIILPCHVYLKINRHRTINMFLVCVSSNKYNRTLIRFQDTRIHMQWRDINYLNCNRWIRNQWTRSYLHLFTSTFICIYPHLAANTIFSYCVTLTFIKCITSIIHITCSDCTNDTVFPHVLFSLHTNPTMHLFYLKYMYTHHLNIPTVWIDSSELYTILWYKNIVYHI